MALSFISSKGVEVESMSPMPSHQAGDLLFAFAYRTTNSVLTPALPSGWNNIATIGATGSSTGNRGRIAWKIAASDSEASGTWTDATELAIHVYRGINPADPIGDLDTDEDGGRPIVLDFDALALEGPGSSWVVGGAGSRGGSHGEGNVNPAGTVDRVTTAEADDLNTWDSNGPVASWGAISGFEINDTLGTNIGLGFVVEIKAEPEGGTFVSPKTWRSSEEVLLANILTLVSGQTHHPVSAETSISRLRAYYTLPKLGLGRNAIYRDLLFQITGTDLGPTMSNQYLLASIRSSLE